MHEDLNLKYRDIKPTLPFYYNLGRRVTAGLGARSLQVAASHSKSYVFGRSYGRTRWDGRRELQCEEPGAGVYDQLSEATSKFTVECGWEGGGWTRAHTNI